MWGSFALAACAVAVLLFAPGCLALRAAGFAGTVAAACAPLVSVAAYGLLCCAYGTAGVECSWATVFLPALAAGAVAFAASRFVRRAGRPDVGARAGRVDAAGPSDAAEALPARASWLSEGFLFGALYVAVGMIVTFFMFLSLIGSPDAFTQSIDNVHHLGTVRALAESSRWPVLSASPYLGADARLDPFAAGSFYPSAWHVLAAMVASSLGVPVTVAVNAANAVLAAVVLPLGMFALIRLSFAGDRWVMAAGSLVSLAGASCPWMLFTWGPLYPNAMAVCLLPAFLSACIVLVAPRPSPDVRALACERGARLRRMAVGALVATGAIALALVQPNGLFSAGVLFAPYLLQRVHGAVRHAGWLAGRGRGAALAAGTVACLLTAAALAAIWVLAFSLPAMRSVVTYDWPSDTALGTALVDVATLGFRADGLQVGCAALCAAGIVVTFRHRQHLWMTFSFMAAAALYVVCVSADGAARQLLAGFWYTDAPRIAAFCTLAAVPLEALGLAALARAAYRARARRGVLAMRAAAAALAVAAAACVLVYLPYYGHVTHEAGGRVFTDGNALQRQAGRIAWEYGSGGVRVLSEAERRFVDEALAAVLPGSVIVNEPSDGSAFAYAIDGMRIYYRDLRGYGEADKHETADSAIVRTRLRDIGTDAEVRAAVESLGAAYVLKLDCDHDMEGSRMWTYDASLWPGIDGIDDETPGFETILARGDMRLYRIVLP